MTTTRGYTLDERIEFRANESPQKHPELPSEPLNSYLYTFMSSDIDGSFESMINHGPVLSNPSSPVLESKTFENGR